MAIQLSKRVELYILEAGGLIDLRFSNISNNQAGFWGAIYATYALVRIYDSVVNNNVALLKGGGVCAKASTVELNRVTVRWNRQSATGTYLWRRRHSRGKWGID